MEITLLVMGKSTSRVFSEAVGDYLDRLRHYVPFSLRVLPDVRNVRNMSASQQKEAEGRAFMAALQPSDFVVLLDERGKEYSSMEFAAYLQGRMSAGLKRVVFVVGGPYGFSPEMYERAAHKISLSRMTLTHELIRLLFVEQLYRAMTILRGESYHHE